MALGLLGTALAGAVKGAGNIADDEIKQGRVLALEKARADAEMKLRETLNGWEEGRFEQTFRLQKSTAEAEAADRAAQAKINQTRLEQEGAYQQKSLANQAAELGIRQTEAGRVKPSDEIGLVKAAALKRLNEVDIDTPEGQKALRFAQSIGAAPTTESSQTWKSRIPDPNNPGAFIEQSGKGAPPGGQGVSGQPAVTYTGDPELQRMAAERAAKTAEAQEAAKEQTAKREADYAAYVKANPDIAAVQEGLLSNKAQSAQAAKAKEESKKSSTAKALKDELGRLKAQIDKAPAGSGYQRTLLEQHDRAARKLFELERGEQP